MNKHKMKKHILHSCIATFAIWISMMLASDIHATELQVESGTDTTAPVINQITMDKTVARKGETVTLSLDVVEEGTGVTSASVSIYTYNEDGLQIISSQMTENLNWYTGTHELQLTIPADAKSGNYYIGQIDIADLGGNKTQYFDGWDKDGYKTDANGSYVPSLTSENKCYIAMGATIAVTNDNGDDEISPKVTNVSIDADKVKNGSTFYANVDVVEEESGIDAITLSFYTYVDGEMKSFSQRQSLDGKKTGTYTIPIKVSGVTRGNLYLGEVQIWDKANNSSDYFDGWNASGYKKDENGYYLPSITSEGQKCYIENGKTLQIISEGDVQDPEIDYVKILTSEVVKPDVARVEVHAIEDDVIDDIRVYLYTYQGNDMYYCGNIIRPDKGTGTYVIEIPITTDVVSGVYRVGQIDITDKAGNVSQYFEGWPKEGYSKNEQGSYIKGFGSDRKKAYIASGADTMTVKDEFDVAFEMGLSNPALLRSVQGLKEGETGQILIDSTKTIKSEIFAAIKGKDVNLAIFSRDYRWLFNGKDITDPKDIALEVTLEDTREMIAGENHNVLKVIFADNGVLPGSAEVRVRSDFFKRYQDHGMNLYYWNPEHNAAQIERDTDVAVKEDGADRWGCFHVKHNSTFLVVDEGNKQDAEQMKDAADKIQAFVSRMYTVVLNRNPDPVGLNTWVGGLSSGTMDGASLARGFICSEEFTKRNLSDADYVDALYHTFFNRDADPIGKDTWMNSLAKGEGRVHVLAGFVNSVEFANLCDQYGIARGTMEEDGSNQYRAGVRNFVLRNYTKALGRKGETLGVEDWCHAINTGRMTALDVAMSFFHSEEYLNKNLSNADYVETLYETFLGRASDAAGKADWVGQLDDGKSRDEVMKGFAYSKEFREIMSAYGV